MELSWTEKLDTSEDKYWEQPVAPTKKRVTFDDILTNMNLVVNSKGVLQFMQPAAATMSYDDGADEELPPKKLAGSSMGVGVPPAVKHSYIYNKYFTNYQDPTVDQTPQYRTPQTKEEYRQMLMDDLRKKIQHQRHIATIKPRQILYTASGPETSIRPPVKTNAPTLRLQKMTFG